MKKEDCYYLGRITKAHGLKGEIQCYFDVNDQMEYEGLDAFFVELNNGLKVGDGYFLYTQVHFLSFFRYY